MKLVLLRYEEGDQHTAGLLLIISGNQIIRQWNVLEPKWKANRKNISRIPEGLYPIKYEYSPKFKRKLWELKDTGTRTEIKIHQGNNVYDTSGCILIGKVKGIHTQRLYKSLESLKEFHSIMCDHLTYDIQIIKSINYVFR